MSTMHVGGSVLVLEYKVLRSGSSQRSQRDDVKEPLPYNVAGMSEAWMESTVPWREGVHSSWRK